MTDRSVVVRLLAVTNQFSAGIQGAGRDVDVLERKISAANRTTTTTSAQASRALSEIGAGAQTGATRAVGAFDKVDGKLGTTRRDAADLKRSMSGTFKSAEDSARSFEAELVRVEAQERALVATQIRAEREMAADFTNRANLRAQATEKVSRGLVLVGAAGVAAAGLAAHAFAGFDKQMSNVRAVSGATEDQMHDLGEAAVVAGRDTVFSASEAAQAEAELAKAGVSSADILGGALTGALSLASAGNLELADAATIAAQSMNIFKLGGSDVSHVADVLAAGANKSAADVKGLGDALRQGGLVSSQLGIGLEDTVGVLSAFADNALIGSDAGTSYKTMLQRLVPQSKEAADAMSSIGFSAFDAQGNFVGLEKVAQGLQVGLGGLTEQQRASTLNTIFGADAVRAANVLYEEGAAGIDNYVRAVNDQGAAARMAATQLDNLSGDVEQLKGSLETALIQSGSGANGTLRELTQGATGAVNSFAALPGPVQATGTGLVAVGGAATTALGAVGFLLPKLRDGRKELELTGRAGTAAARGLGALGKVGVVGAVAAAAATGLHALTVEVDKLRGAGAPKVDELTNSLLDLTDAGKATGETARLFGDDLSNLNRDVGQLEQTQGKFSRGFGLLPNQFDTYRKQLNAVDDSLAALVQGGNAEEAARIFNILSNAVASRGNDPADFAKHLDDYKAALTGVDTEQKLASGSATELGGALTETTTATSEADTALEDYIDTLDDYAGRVFGVQEAQDSLTGAYQALRDQIKQAKKDGDDNATSLNGGSEAARNNRDALRGIVDETANVVAKMLEHGASVKDVNVFIKKQRDRLEETRTELGLAKGAVKRYDDAIRHVPDDIPVTASTKQIDQAIARVIELRRLAGIPVSVSIGVLNKQRAAGMATGGWVDGGTPGRDSVLRVLMPGEFVVRESAARRNAGWLEAINGGQRLTGMATGGWSTGVPAGTTSVAGRSQLFDSLVVHDRSGNSRQTAADAVDALADFVFKHDGVVV